MIDVNSSMNFIDSLLHKYSWQGETKAIIEKELTIVKKKKNDTNLYLSIVGEFSSGKSTFINALLRENLLETDVLQGTTVASTIIKYSPTYSFTVVYKNGTSNIKGNGRIITVQMLKEYIKQYTTESDISQNIQEIIIGHPAQFLKKGIVIIDTPGTNAQERWHEDVTKRAIKEISDVSIILTTADKPMPITLNQFVAQNLSEVLPRCIFVATKMDLLRANERERQLKYINKKIHSEFDVETQAYPYSPLYVLAKNNKEIAINHEESDINSLVEKSYLTEELIIQQLMKQRQAIQTEKIQSILKNMFTKINNDMSVMKATYEKNHQILVNAKKLDLLTFMNTIENTTFANFNNQMQEIKDYYMDIVNDNNNSYKSKIYDETSQCSSREAINSFNNNNKLKKNLEECRQQIIEIIDDFPTVCQQFASDTLNEFWSAFSMNYSELKKLEYFPEDLINTDLNVEKNNIGINIDVKITSSGGISKVATGGAGAVIGTIIAPGIGTIIGGLLGSFFGDSFEDTKRTWRNEITNATTKYTDEAKESVSQYMNKVITETRKSIMEKKEECFATYDSVIKEMIVRDERKRLELEQNIRNINIDLNKIKSMLL